MQNQDQDYISRFNAVVDESAAKAAKVVNTYAKPKYIAAILEIIISAVAIIGIQVVAMGFDFSKLTEWQFWVKTLSLTACIFLLYRAVVNARFERTGQRQNVLDAQEKYKALVSGKELDLKDFLEEFNLQNKINAYIYKINSRINRLERKRIKTYNAMKKQRLVEKILVLKEEITPDRIKEVINIVHVKYYVVYYDDFENVERLGGNGRISTRGLKDYNRSFNLKSFDKMWIYILTTSILSISIWSFGDAKTITIIANVLSSLVMIITRILSALVESDRIYDSTITASYVCKTEILAQYYQWRDAKKLNVNKEKEQVTALGPEVA